MDNKLALLCPVVSDSYLTIINLHRYKTFELPIDKNSMKKNENQNYKFVIIKLEKLKPFEKKNLRLVVHIVRKRRILSGGDGAFWPWGAYSGIVYIYILSLFKI